MILDSSLVLLGIALLLLGGDLLVRGACGLAVLLRVSPAVAGLTVVAAGTSMPELVVSVQSAWRGSPGLALGNVVGSNIFNIAVILGMTALVRPLSVPGTTIRLEWPVMALAALQLHLLARDGAMDRFEGACLLAAMVGFVAYLVWVARCAAHVEVAEFEQLSTLTGERSGAAAWRWNGFGTILGVGLLAGGSSALVGGASRIAGTLGVSETLIGLTIVAAGTSLPELTTSLVAAFRRRDEVAVANVVGSNIFNVFGIVGTTSLLQPILVPNELLARDHWWMLGLTVILFPILWSGRAIVRAEGGLLLGVYAVYFAALVVAR